jgi:hypothetical protein
MNIQHIGYAIACVVVPMLWGLLVVWASNRIERKVKARGIKRGQTEEEATVPPLDYHI